jgi:hypothetical protein
MRNQLLQSVTAMLASQSIVTFEQLDGVIIGLYSDAEILRHGGHQATRSPTAEKYRQGKALSESERAAVFRMGLSKLRSSFLHRSKRRGTFFVDKVGRKIVDIRPAMENKVSGDQARGGVAV